MRLIPGFVLGLVLAHGAHAQSDAASAPSPAASTQMDTTPVVATVLLNRTKGAATTNNQCNLAEPTKALPAMAVVIVVQKVRCTSAQKWVLGADYYEVLYRGERLLVALGASQLSPVDQEIVATRTVEAIESNIVGWQRASLKLWINQMQEARDALKRTEKFGLAIFKAGVYDVSEYTEGTGFSATIHNTGRKPIKYVTINLVGLNAVKDPVQGRRGSATVTLRGIGPIEPDESVTYSKDYMWMTDVVIFHRIGSIRLDFMDGTSRTSTDAKSLTISGSALKILEAMKD